MTAKGLHWREARRALIASGLRRSAVLSLLWPFGREERARRLMRQRRAVLEAKNHVIEYLSRAQRPLDSLGLATSEDLRTALEAPEKRGLIMGVAINRPMMEEVLAARHEAEVGPALDQALAELVAEGVVLKVSGMPVLTDDIHVIAGGRAAARYDLSGLTRLLGEGRDYGGELRARLRRKQRTDVGRTHQL